MLAALDICDPKRVKARARVNPRPAAFNPRKDVKSFPEGGSRALGGLCLGAKPLNKVNPSYKFSGLAMPTSPLNRDLVDDIKGLTQETLPAESSRTEAGLLKAARKESASVLLKQLEEASDRAFLLAKQSLKPAND